MGFPYTHTASAPGPAMLQHPSTRFWGTFCVTSSPRDAPKATAWHGRASWALGQRLQWVYRQRSVAGGMLSFMSLQWQMQGCGNEGIQ